MESLETRKKDHIDLAFKSQTGQLQIDTRFHYEPMLAAHPANGLPSVSFLGKELRAPLWVSSMTGGTKMAGTINRNLATACKEFGMGMGLGSCRIIINDDTYLDDFNMRPYIGYDFPLWANLGIAQIEELIAEDRVDLATNLVKKLEADGLIIHVNPMQEWFQPEGDILVRPPLDSIKRFMDIARIPVIVKEVGQGIGPESIKELLSLPLEALEFAAFGGTNFARVELLRDEKADVQMLEPLSYVGEDADSMVEYVNNYTHDSEPACKSIIISGGIKNYLDGYYLLQRSEMPAIYGMASTFLEHAREDYEQLQKFVRGQIKGLEMAFAYLRIK